jgi:hypothetical protein
MPASMPLLKMPEYKMSTFNSNVRIYPYTQPDYTDTDDDDDERTNKASAPYGNNMHNTAASG